MRLASDTALLNDLRQAGQREVQKRFSVSTSAKILEAGFRQDTVNGNDIEFSKQWTSALSPKQNCNMHF